LIELAQSAGGEEPKPKIPETTFLDEIRLSNGNEQLLAIYNKSEEIKKYIEEWTQQAIKIDKNWPNWITLKRLMKYSTNIQDSEIIFSQIRTIEKQRQLLVEPDPILPLIKSLDQILRKELNSIKSEMEILIQQGELMLNTDKNWNKLEPEQKFSLREPHGLTEGKTPEINVSTTDLILQTLDRHSITSLKDRSAALPGRYQKILLEAAQLLEPKSQRANFPSATLSTEEDVDKWLKETAVKLKEQIKKGPVIIS